MKTRTVKWDGSYLKMCLNPDWEVDFEIVDLDGHTNAKLSLRTNLDAEISRGYPPQMSAQLNVTVTAKFHKRE